MVQILATTGATIVLFTGPDLRETPVVGSIRGRVAIYNENLAKIAEQYLKKGSLVYIEGRLKTDKYEDKGEIKYFTKVVALLLQMLDRKPAAARQRAHELQEQRA